MRSKLVCTSPSPLQVLFLPPGSGLTFDDCNGCSWLSHDYNAEVEDTPVRDHFLLGLKWVNKPTSTPNL